MKPSIFISLLALWLFVGSLMAQSNVVAGEWFIDAPDPGFGNATAFSNFTPDSVVDINVQSALSSLAPGLHYWNIRVKNSLGFWSHTYPKPFILLARDSASDLVGGEWFWDSDPGYGAGNPMILTDGEDTAALMISVDSLPVGIHSLFVRLKNAEGIWSHSYQRNTFIRAKPKALLEKITYFFRSPVDTTVTYTYLLEQAQEAIDLSFEPDTTDLINGTTYELCLKVFQTDGEMSCEDCQSFLYQQVDTTGTTKASNIQNAGFGFYPNPNDGEFGINLPENRTDDVIIKVYDPKGRLVSSKITLPIQHNKQKVSLQNPTPGIYFAVVEMGTRIYIKRILVK